MTETICKNTLVRMDPWGILLGALLFVLSSLSIVPSLQKPMRRRSTAGMSPVTLLLTNLQQTLAVANIIIMKFPQVKMCASDPLGCQPSLIVLYQTVTCWLLLFFVYLCTVWYPDPPDEGTGKWNRLVWQVQCCCCFPFIFCVAVWSAASDCGPALGSFGTLCGAGSSVLMLVRFMPQLHLSCVARTAGSISYITYAVVGTGGFIATYFQVFISRERVSTWMPVFIGNCCQTAILAVCLYHDYGRRRRPTDLMMDQGTSNILIAAV